MKNLMRVEVQLEVQTSSRDLKGLYNDENCLFMNLGYLKIGNQMLEAFDLESFCVGGTYRCILYFKQPEQILFKPKLFYDLKIFENEKNVVQALKVLSINYFPTKNVKSKTVKEKLSV